GVVLWVCVVDGAVCCFFFFQAEDGIRDFHVTGVQTCALPILTAGDAAGLTEPEGAVTIGPVDCVWSSESVQPTMAAASQTLWAKDRKSTRLNSSHVKISYAVFCLKKKNKTKKQYR